MELRSGATSAAASGKLEGHVSASKQLEPSESSSKLFKVSTTSPVSVTSDATSCMMRAAGEGFMAAMGKHNEMNANFQRCVDEFASASRQTATG